MDAGFSHTNHEAHMLARVKRTKDGASGPSVAYATVITSQGSIGGWSTDPNEGVAITEAVGRKVAEFHKGRSNVGTLTFEKVKADAATIAAATAHGEKISNEEFKALQDECAAAIKKNVELVKHLGEAHSAVKEAIEQRDEFEDDLKAAVVRVRELEERVKIVDAENAKLLEAATKPAAGAATKPDHKNK